MVNLAAALATAQSLFAGVLATSGTTVSISRGAHDVLGAPLSIATLAVTMSETQALHQNVPALVIPAGQIPTTDLPHGVDVTDGDLVVHLDPTLTDLRAGDLLTVNTCRDPALIGPAFAITFVEASFAGVTRRLIATRPGALRGTSG